MTTLGNVIWFICGGLVMGLAWGILGCVFMISIIGIPWAKASFVIAGFTFFPFGKEAISRSELTHEEDIGTGVAGMLGNIIWFIVAGIWLAIGHVSSAIMCFITIIGIPFGIQHLKLAVISLAPIGKTVVPIEVADTARMTNADRKIREN